MMPGLEERANLLEAYFVCRADAYALQNPNGTYTAVRQPLTNKLLLQHCQGTRTVSTYLVSGLGHTKAGILDIDSKESQVQEFILWVKRWLGHFQIPCFIEDSGRRGFHLWILFKCWVPTTKARRLLNAAIEYI